MFKAVNIFMMTTAGKIFCFYFTRNIELYRVYGLNTKDML